MPSCLLSFASCSSCGEIASGMDKVTVTGLVDILSSIFNLCVFESDMETFSSYTWPSWLLCMVTLTGRCSEAPYAYAERDNSQ